jgi:hypothetical protein
MPHQPDSDDEQDYVPSISASDEEQEQELKKKRPVCKYGASCYRKNKQHLKDYYHPHLESMF